MKSLKIILVAIICIPLLSTTCKDQDCHDTVKIVNNSDKAIYFDFSYRYPDTLLVDNTISGDDYKKVLANSTGKEINSSCFDGEINGSKGGKIMVYIFDAYTYENTPWEEVVKNYKILKRYDLTEDELTKMNWTVTYP